MDPANGMKFRPDVSIRLALRLRQNRWNFISTKNDMGGLCLHLRLGRVPVLFPAANSIFNIAKNAMLGPHFPQNMFNIPAEMVICASLFGSETEIFATKPKPGHALTSTNYFNSFR